MDYADTHIRICQELREVYRLANEGEMIKALERAVDVRSLASELVYAIKEMKKS